MQERKRQKRECSKIAEVDGRISPEDFFERFVLPRTPVKFSSLIDDVNWNGRNWSNKLLREKSGHAVLRVESRSGPNESFGRGNEEKITFGEFLDSLDSNIETSYYLTTQELSYTHEGQPSLTSPPVDGLIGDFPWVPKLCGNLIPQNINMWFGSSKLPTSSGLHHDFHDNLYILLRGEKTITLFDPKEALNMYTEGEIVKVYPNGRINYKNQLTNADGSDEASLSALKASSDLDIAADLLATAEAEDDIDAAEKRVEDALEALLDAEIRGNEDEEEGDSDDEVEDDDEGEYSGTGYEALNLLRNMEENNKDDDSDNNDFVCDDHYMDSDEEKIEAARINKTSSSSSNSNHYVGKPVQSVANSNHISGLKTPAPANVDKNGSCMEISVTDANAHSLAGVSTSIKSPPNFSKVMTSLSPEQLAKQFPLYYEVLTNNTKNGEGDEVRKESDVRLDEKDRKSTADVITGGKSKEPRPRCIEVTIRAGEMLFIPTGWFHEVRSTGGGSDGHLAFNYWFHPPDGQTFEKPYSSDFWPNDWKKRNLK